VTRKAVGSLGRVRLALALPFLALATSVAAQEPPSISVNVNLVVLHATARDRNGEFVSGLRQQDFQAFEDGRLQTITLFRHEDTPVSVGLIVDNSASMRRKRADVTAAALAFIRASNPKDEAFVVNFNEHVKLGLPAGKFFSDNPAELQQALDSANPGGMTALYDAIDRGLEHLKRAGHDKKVLIVVSDGGDNASRRRLDQVLADAERSDAIIYTIGVFDENDADRNPGVLRKIARATGGTAFFPSTSAEVTPICERIAAEIRHQYTIGYAPSNPKLDGSYRTIRVTATRPHGGRVFVRARTGYIAGPPPESPTAQGGGK
jgi:Ca-activated chloride channel homolog